MSLPKSMPAKCLVSVSFLLSVACSASVEAEVLQLISPALVRKLLLKMGEKISMTHNPRFRYEDWGPTFLSAVFIKEAVANIC
uniref:Uncharacterized protein n=1 Tax=Oryzias sinensis TaxID=183150 RepID=A0A8C7X5Q3_9TELE